MNARFSDIFRNYGSRTDDDVITNCDRQNGRICSDADSVTDLGWSPQIWFTGGSTSLKAIIDKHGAMRDETIVANGDKLTNEGV